MESKNNSQLFMLHFAGGNVYSFQFLKPYLSAGFELHPVELPGRGRRMSEKLLLTKIEAVEDLVSQIASVRNNQPYLVYGHSMGATLGLRIVKKMEDQGDPPERLIVSGNAGPGTGSDKCRSAMNNNDLKDELRGLGGVPEEVLDNEDLFNFFAPIMRADFSVLENGGKLEPGFKIHSPITAVMGNREESSEKIENWKKFTRGEFKSYLLPGNHFFIHDHPSDLTKIIKNVYDRPLVF